jgi:hypothetical protein
MNESKHPAPIARALIIVLVTSLVAFAGALAARRVVRPDDQRIAHALVEHAEAARTKGDSATAVVDLERARMLAPRDGIVRDALEASGVRDPEPAVARAFRALDSREWAALAIVSGFLAAAALALFAHGKRRSTMRVVAATALASCAAGVAGVVIANAYAPAVVASGAGTLLVAPYDGAATAAPLTAGTVVSVGEQHGRFFSVRTADHGRGWMGEKDLLAVTRETS